MSRGKIQIALLSLTALFPADASAQPRPVVRYANRLGGSGADVIAAVAIDSAGAVYLAGTTTSTDFPAANRLVAAPSSYFPGQGSVFVAKIDPSGQRIVYATILAIGAPAALGVNNAGSVYLAGTDSGSEFSVTAGAVAAPGRCFLLKLDPTGSRLVYAARLGCKNGADFYSGGLTLDPSGNAYLTGWTNSGADLPITANAWKKAGFGPFALKLSADGSRVVYATYLPGEESFASAHPRTIALDSTGAAYIAGSANLRGFPITVDSLPREKPADINAASDDVFVLKLSPDGSALPFATLLGGYGSDYASAIAPDADGSILLAGTSRWTSGFTGGPFPTTEGAADAVSGFPKGFLARLTPDATSLLFSTFVTGTDNVPCLAPGVDGIDVLGSGLLPGLPAAGAIRLLRFSGDGQKLLNSSLVGLGRASGCAATPGLFTSFGVDGAGPEMIPLGEKARLGFTVIEADRPGAPALDLDIGEISLAGVTSQTGAFPPVTRKIQATADGQDAAVLITAPGPLSITPSLAHTPAEFRLDASQGSYNQRLTVVAFGVHNGIQSIPVVMRPGQFRFEIAPLESGFIPLSAPSASSTPATANLQLSTSASTDAFGTFYPAPLDVRFSANGIPWLSTAPLTGTTPVDFTVTANPTGLPDGLRTATLSVTGPGVSPFTRPPSASIPLRFQVGPPAAVPARLLASSYQLEFRLSNAVPQSAAQLHLTSTAEPQSFSFENLPDWINVSPASGTTPADVTVTANSTSGSGRRYATATLRAASGTSTSINLTEVVAAADYLGSLSLSSFGQPLAAYAPGQLVSIAMDTESWFPPQPDAAADPATLPSNLAGFRFTLDGVPLALRSYQSGTFIAQIPTSARPGSADLEGFDAAGRKIAKAPVSLVASAPVFLPDSSSRAHKPDGGVIDAGNPVAPGEAIVIRLTGQGVLKPSIETGLAAQPDGPVVPVLPVTATVGGKPARVLQAIMSNTEAGVLDVWIEVPRLYDDDHYVSVSVGSNSAPQGIPIRVRSKATPDNTTAQTATPPPR